nr:MAG TPA: hypothetical protein [Caudoviricetes sp.]DAX15685.1 MAG TPA: hypothetical protein [Caudoviricetes sp.]
MCKNKKSAAPAATGTTQSMPETQTNVSPLYPISRKMQEGSVYHAGGTSQLLGTAAL